MEIVFFGSNQNHTWIRTSTGLLKLRLDAYLIMCSAIGT
jgi:hypothetical protein